MLVASGMGGDIVYVVSKNAVSAGPDNVAYGAAKADQAHQVRLLAAELGQHGIRVNGVNPDGVVEGSGIFSGDWREERARRTAWTPTSSASSTPSRTLLGEEVLPRARRRRRRRAHRRRALPHHRARSCPSTVASPPRSCVEPGGDSDDDAASPQSTIVDVEADLVAAHERDLDRCGERLSRVGVDVDAVIDEVASLLGRGAVVGGRHRRHPLRPLPHRRRAAHHRGEDRRRRGARTRSPARTAPSACTCPGTIPTIRCTAGARRRARASASTR